MKKYKLTKKELKESYQIHLDTLGERAFSFETFKGKYERLMHYLMLDPDGKMPSLDREINRLSNQLGF